MTPDSQALLRQGKRRHIWRVRVKFEPRDLWLGVYWDNTCGLCRGGGNRGFHDYPCRPCNGTGRLSDFLKVYVCLLPCLPILVTRWTLPEECPSSAPRVHPLEGS